MLCAVQLVEDGRLRSLVGPSLARGLRAGDRRRNHVGPASDGMRDGRRTGGSRG